MKKKFNNEHTPKSSENCGKYSKSVSYETLVGGTATTGREIKQTQKMFLGSADKPLSAVGTLTSLLCNSAKVVEKLFYRHSEPKAKNPKKTETVIIGRGCEPIISAESLYCHARPRSDISAESKRDPRLIAMQSPRMTEKALSFLSRCCASEKQKESSLILRKAKFQAIFKFVLSSASGGAGGGKYNRISAFVSMPVLLIRSSLEKFFKKNFRDDRLFLGFAEVLVLALLFTLVTISESRADDENLCVDKHGITITCIGKLSDANGKNSCGTNCTFKVIEENGKQVLHIYKEDISKPATIRAGAFSPTYYAGNQVLDATGSVLPLNNIMLDNDFEKIGDYAFAGSGAQISSANGKFVFQDTGNYLAHKAGIGEATFNGDILFIRNPHITVLERTNIKGDIIFAEGLSNINGLSLMDTHIDGNIIIPSSIKQIGDRALFRSSITGQIYCASGVEACYDMVKAGCLSQLEATRRTTCLNSLESLFKANKFSAYPDGCEKLEANLKCTKCKSASFKLEDDGWCLRKIYTPAEAAEVLKDDNTNEVTITFKK